MKIFKEYWLYFVFVILSILIIGIVFFTNECVFHFSENTGLYLFSALIQSNAALISIFGVFYIFRLQSLQSAISVIFESLCHINYNIANAAREFHHISLEAKKTKIDSYKSDNQLGNEYKRWYDYEVSIHDIKSLIKKPTIIIITLISLQIVFLIFSNNIHILGNFFEIVSFSVITIFQIYVFVLLGKTIFKMVE